MAIQEPAAAPDIGTVVKLLIEASGGDYQAAARAIGRSPQALSGKIKNRRRFTPNELSRLAHHFGVKPGIFFVAPMDFFKGAATSDRFTDFPGWTPLLHSLPAPDLSLPVQLALPLRPGLSPLPSRTPSPDSFGLRTGGVGGQREVGVRAVAT